MAAYAALVSLFNNLEQIRNQPRFLASFKEHQIQSLAENIDFFLDFLESYNNSYGGVSKEEAEELESQIASAAHEAEDVIESQIVDLILPRSVEIIPHLRHSCLFDLQKVILDMDMVKIKVLKVKEERGFNDQKPTNFTPAASSQPLTTGKSSMVGFDDELMQLKDVLTSQQSSRQIISIVGMGGTGKTTLAKNIYEDSLSVHHFDLRAWATISQEYNVRDILLQLLSIQGKSTNETVDDLGLQLHQRLIGRRYLIMLDDMWCIDVWDRLKFYFPDNGDGSQVVLTTRLSKVADQLRSFCIRINFLDEHKSWDLFCQKVFGEDNCPLELVGTGKKIVEQCKGLPLTIVVIGGLLRKSIRIEEYWQNVAKNINSILNLSENGQCLEVLNLSYSHLPAHLKPCFLYMGTFKEDHEIRVSEIIKLWVAEGFLRPNGTQILEEMAEDYLKDLIDRNLILVCTDHPNGKTRSCRIHDLLRELCVRVANKENFFCVVRAHSIPRGINSERRLIFHDTSSNNLNTEVFKALQPTSLSRSLICAVPEAPVMCRLLRVLDTALIPNLKSVFQNVNLRYVAYRSDYFRDASMLCSSISLIWNLQTLIIEGTNQQIILPSEIWSMPQLRHLKCSRIFLPDPPLSEKADARVVLGNLQTVKRASNFRLSEETCKRIPNIKKLSIECCDFWEGYEDSLYDNLQNLGCLHILESLNIWCSKRISVNELKNAFPTSLKKLSLGGCVIHWDDLSTISGSVPQLEVLKLNVLSCKANKWSSAEGGFLRLKLLTIVSCHLNSWCLDSTSYFPVLEKLVLIYLSELKEIPSSFGQLSTLQLIRLEYCSESLAISAMKIKEEQVSFGNEELQVQFVMSIKKREKLRKRVKIEGSSIGKVHSGIALITSVEKAFNQWDVLILVLRWWLSIKRCIARKSSVAPIPSYCDAISDSSIRDSVSIDLEATDSMDLSWTSHGQSSDSSNHDSVSMDSAFSATEYLKYNEEELNANDSMDGWDHSWTFPGQISNNSICDTVSMYPPFSANEYWNYLEEDFSLNLGTLFPSLFPINIATKRWSVLFWVLRWRFLIKRIVARKNSRTISDSSIRDSVSMDLAATHSMDRRDLSLTFHGQVSDSSNHDSVSMVQFSTEYLKYTEEELTANDSIDGWDRSWALPGQVFDNSICDTVSMYPTFSANEYKNYLEEDFSSNLGTFFPSQIPIKMATNRWSLLFWVLRWRFSIKRIVARKNRRAQDLYSPGSLFVESDSKEWWDLPWIFHGQIPDNIIHDIGSMALLNANDPMFWWDHAWTSPGQVSDNSASDTESMAPAFSTN